MTDVMTVREVAEYLKVKDRTIYRLVANREIPGFQGRRLVAVPENRDRPMDRIERGRAE